jgi:hypothetical protein
LGQSSAAQIKSRLVAMETLAAIVMLAVVFVFAGIARRRRSAA